MLDSLISCIPTIIGALIVIIPTLINKIIEAKFQREQKLHLEKQTLYVDLITLLGSTLKEPNKHNLDELREKVNLISITGSVDVVKALNDYIDTWGGKGDQEEQNQKFNQLLKTIRVDLEIDKKINKDFPDIGLRDINILN